METDMGCSDMPAIAYDELSSSLRNKSSLSFLPISGNFELTGRCNLRCIHCYVRDTYTTEELSYEEICDILDQIAEAGCLWLLFTGGEPLIRKDFTKIYQYAKKKGFILFILSNATLITPDIADLFAEQPPFLLDVTMYGYTAETYEKMTGVSGSFEKFMNGIKLAIDRNLNLQLKTIPTTINVHEFIDMYRFAESLGISFRYDAKIHRKKDGSDEPLQYRLTPEEILSLDLCIPELRETLTKEYTRMYGAPKKTDSLYICGAGKDSFFITCDGILNTCTLSTVPGYDLRKGKFLDGFKLFPEAVNVKRTRESECQTCPVINICGQCPPYCELEHGDPEQTIEFLCELAKLRAKTFVKLDNTASK
jgi:radical SAM protein with 4Fe4S-binding SPASM domain